MVVDMGTSSADNVGDLVEFGSCGTAAKMQRRGVVRRNVLQRGGTDDKCRRHMFGLASPDEGKTLYVTDQVSGVVLGYNGSTGKALDTLSPTETADDMCAGLIADWSAAGEPGLGLRGICLNSAAQLMMPYDSIQDASNSTDINGIFGIDPRNHSSGELYWISALQGVGYQAGLSVDQTPDNTSSRLDVYTDSSLQVHAGNIAINKSAFAQPNSTECSQAHGNNPTTFVCGQDKYTEFGVHKPSVCQVTNNKLYFNTRQSSTQQRATGLFQANAVVELDLETNETRVFTDPSLGFTEDLLINEDVLYVLARRSLGGGKVEARRRALSWRTKAAEAPRRGDLVRFNLTTGEFLGGVVDGSDLSGQFPDQPVQMTWSMC
jgi:hypothetical protein